MAIFSSMNSGTRERSLRR